MIDKIPNILFMIGAACFFVGTLINFIRSF